MSPKLSVAGDVAGKLFHRRGPATVKLLSPKVVCVRGTVSDRYEDEVKRNIKPEMFLEANKTIQLSAP